jgi:pyruvate dehydrogenase (quinone)
VQIDVNAARLGLRFPTEVTLQGSAQDTLEALLPLLEVKTDTTWREPIPRTQARRAH